MTVRVTIRRGFERFQRFCRFAASDMVVGSEVRKNVFPAIVVGRKAAFIRGRQQSDQSDQLSFSRTDPTDPTDRTDPMT